MSTNVKVEGMWIVVGALSALVVVLAAIHGRLASIDRQLERPPFPTVVCPDSDKVAVRVRPRPFNEPHPIDMVPRDPDSPAIFPTENNQ